MMTISNLRYPRKVSSDTETITMYSTLHTGAQGELNEGWFDIKPFDGEYMNDGWNGKGQTDLCGMTILQITL